MMLRHASIGNPAELARHGLLGIVMQFAVKFDELLQALPEGELARIANTDPDFVTDVETHGYDDHAPELNLEGFGFPDSFNCFVHVERKVRAMAMGYLYVSADGTRARGKLYDGAGDELLVVEGMPVSGVVKNLAEATLAELKADLARWSPERRTQVA
ncbi:MAG: hypothetical protein HY434_00625 [Candidatus Liptonbacteria bacterium]|nr:hypothetical protein [Parcubacteria group bacterium]MBI4087320.1 hypothetical protein [Candidatus Liptonbacteria bacterium]